MRRRSCLALGLLLCLAGCKKEAAATAEATRLSVGLVTDVGGRGDQSFNDSALRGLELWAAGLKYQSGKLEAASPQEVERSVPAELAAQAIKPLGITPKVMQSKA